jgi:hypothetical protein
MSSMRLSRLFSCVVLASAVVATPEERPGSLDGERVRVRLVLLGTSVAGATHEVVMAGASLGVGENAAVRVAVGSRDPALGRAAHLCIGGAASYTDSDTAAKEFLHTWVARTKLREAALDHIDLEVDWERHDTDAKGVSKIVAGDRRLITLAEGERHLLDFIDDPHARDRGGCSRNVVVEATAAVEEDPALADQVIEYDMWLVDEPPHGGRSQRTTRRWQATGRQGEHLEYSFPSVNWSASQGPSDSKGAAVNVWGEIRGRVRRDGTLAIRLYAARSIMGPNGGVGDAGEKLVRVGPGETVSLELPADQTYQIMGGGVLDPRPMIEGHSMSLILTSKTRP